MEFESSPGYQGAVNAKTVEIVQILNVISLLSTHTLDKGRDAATSCTDNSTLPVTMATRMFAVLSLLPIPIVAFVRDYCSSYQCETF